MESGNNLVQVKGGKLKLLLKEIGKRRPDHHLPDIDWKKMPEDDRKVRLDSLISMRGFSDIELKKLEKDVNRVRITWVHGLILLIIAVGVVGYWGYKVNEEYKKMATVYA